MSRGLTAEQLAAVSAKTIRPAYFAFLDFAEMPVRVWSGKGDYTIAEGQPGAGTYTGVGILGGISEIEETNNPVANGVALTLSGIPSELIATALDRKTYRGRKVRIWQGFFAVEDDGHVLIGPPIPSFAGRMDTMVPTETGTTSTITLNCENRLVDLQRSRESRRTNVDFLRRHPNDYSLRWVAGLQDKEFMWGRKA